MITLILSLLLQVTVPGEMSCIGSVVDFTMPSDLYIAGLEQEGTTVLATEGQIVYLNGPRTDFLKVGDINSVVRSEGTVRDPSTGKDAGFYYKDVGTIRIESVGSGVAMAIILQSCCEMTKGDLVIPRTEKPAVQFSGEESNALTTVPSQGITGKILLGKDDFKELSDGMICYINRGWRDGVEVGDRFTVFRPNPPFDRRELGMEGVNTLGSHSSLVKQGSRSHLDSMLKQRILPDTALGDIVVLDAGETASAAKIINSRMEIHPGDFVIKR